MITYWVLYLILGCTFVLGWIAGAFFTRNKLEESFGRLLADICEEDAGLRPDPFVPFDYPKDVVDREWEQLMRDRMS